MLGVNGSNRDSVHGSTKVAWRRTLGWTRAQLLALSQTKARSGGRVTQSKAKALAKLEAAS